MILKNHDIKNILTRIMENCVKFLSSNSFEFASLIFKFCKGWMPMLSHNAQGGSALLPLPVHSCRCNLHISPICSLPIEFRHQFSVGCAKMFAVFTMKSSEHENLIIYECKRIAGQLNECKIDKKMRSTKCKV